jgi:hypothetical protein
VRGSEIATDIRIGARLGSHERIHLGDFVFNLSWGLSRTLTAEVARPRIGVCKDYPSDAGVRQSVSGGQGGHLTPGFGEEGP